MSRLGLDRVSTKFKSRPDICFCLRCKQHGPQAIEVWKLTHPDRSESPTSSSPSSCCWWSSSWFPGARDFAILILSNEYFATGIHTSEVVYPKAGGRELRQRRTLFYDPVDPKGDRVSEGRGTHSERRMTILLSTHQTLNLAHQFSCLPEDSALEPLDGTVAGPWRPQGKFPTSDCKKRGGRIS